MSALNRGRTNTLKPHTSNEQTLRIRNTYVTYIRSNRSYFFCSASSADTEGIKDVKNFAALLAPYRATPLLRLVKSFPQVVLVSLLITGH